MANGTSRYALAQIQLKRGSAASQMQEEKALDKAEPRKIPLKNPSKTNHSK